VCSFAINGVAYGAFLSVYSNATVGLSTPQDSTIVGFNASDVASQAGKAIVTYEYADGAKYGSITISNGGHEGIRRGDTIIYFYAVREYSNPIGGI
jgi:hypothetical protein